MQEVSVKTHLIVTDIHEEYTMNWCGKIMDVVPKIKNGLPIFVIIGAKGRMELNTIDMTRIENSAKSLTYPKGKSSITTDTAHIYIKDINGYEKLMGILTHKHIKHFAPMYDKVGFI